MIVTKTKFVNYVLTALLFVSCPQAGWTQTPRATISPDLTYGRFQNEPEHYTLDATTTQDLEVDRLVDMILQNQPMTPFGIQRTKWLLTHPYKDPAEIQRRQTMIKELADNPELLKILKGSLTEIYNKMPPDWRNNNGNSREELNQRFFADFRTLNFAPYDYSKGKHSQILLLSEIIGIPVQLLAGVMFYFVPASTALSATPSDFNPTNLGLLSLTLVGGLGVGYIIGSRQLKERDATAIPTVLFVKRFLNVASNLAKKLANADQKVLQEASHSCSYKGICADFKRLVLSIAQPETNVFNSLIKGSGLTGILNGPIERWLVAMDKTKISEMFKWIGELEFLVRSAELYNKHRDNLKFPEISEQERPSLEYNRTVHPLLWGSSKSQANDFFLDANPDSLVNKTLIVTGPNAWGKSTAIKTIGVNALFAASGLPLWTTRSRLTPMLPFTIFPRVYDQVDGSSTFMEQGRRLTQIGKLVGFDPAVKSTNRVLVLTDEILTGTSSIEHRAAEWAAIETLHEDAPGAVVIAASHERSLANMATDGHSRVGAIHVSNQPMFSVQPGRSTSFNAYETLSRADVGVQQQFLNRIDQRLRPATEAICESAFHGTSQ